MKRSIRTFLVVFLLIFSMTASMLPAQAAWDDGLILTALDDQVIPITDSSMPLMVDGVIYLTYILFDANQNGGANFQVYYGGTDLKTVTMTFYDRNGKTLVFDLTTGLSYDTFPGGQVQRPTMILRSGRIYLSANSFCQYFGDFLHYYYGISGYDYPVVRISGNDAKFSDADFVKTATYAFLNVINTYYTAQLPVIPVMPWPDGSTPLPTPSPTPTPTPTPPPSPNPIPNPDPEIPTITTYLGLRCDQGDPALYLNTLHDARQQAVLFFHPDDLIEQDDLLRQALAQGHVIGLIAEGTLEEATAILEAGNDLLAHILRTETVLVLCEDADLRNQLSEAHWLCWQSTLDGRDMTSATLTATLERQTETTWILIDSDDAGLAPFARLLSTLNGEQYIKKLAVETRY